MQKSFSVKVKEVRVETPNCVSVAFDIPDDLKSQFSYKAGQYVNLIKTVGSEELHRSYSLCSSPLDKEWRVAIKHLEGGAFSSYANTILKAGDHIELMPPMGKFTCDLDPSKSMEYLFIASGSGITPCISLIKTILRLQPASRIKLFYGSKRNEEIIFLEELQSLKNKFLDRIALYFFLSQEQMEEEIFYGRIDSDKINFLHHKLFHVEEIDRVFICGPEDMIFSVKDTLIGLGLDEEKIHFELFGTKGLAVKEIKNATSDGRLIEVQLKADGRTMYFKMNSGSDNVLDAALKNKARLPYACKGGVCCTCKAKLLEGKVELVKNYGLEPDELAAGYILTCQAIPSTDFISVDYDQ